MLGYLVLQHHQHHTKHPVSEPCVSVDEKQAVQDVGPGTAHLLLREGAKRVRAMHTV